MTHLYLIRHAAFTVDTPSDDPGLSAVGIAQAERLRERLANQEIAADILISSSLRRAKETAETIAPALGLPVIFDEDFEEWHNINQSLSAEEFMAQILVLPMEQRPYFTAYAGGENWLKFAMRACAAFNRITEEYAGKKIIVVCHGGIIEASFLYAWGLSPLQPLPVMMMLDPAYTSITHWHKISEVYRWRLEGYNDASHLR